MPKSRLPAGTYLARCKERTLLAAAANGHSGVWPSAEAVSDGEWVKFFRDGREVYACNAAYAAHHFDATMHAASGMQKKTGATPD